MLCSKIARQFLVTKSPLTHLAALPARHLTTAQTSDEAPKPIDPADFKALEERLKLAEASTADFKDKYMRALAETENVRNRMIKVSCT